MVASSQARVCGALTRWINGFGDKLKLHVAVEAQVDQGLHNSLQRERAITRCQPVVIRCWTAAAVCQAHNDHMADDRGQQAQQVTLSTEMPEIEGEPDKGVPNRVDKLPRLDKLVEEAASRRGRRMGLLEGQPHAMFLSDRCEPLQGFLHEPPGVAEGVAAAAAGVDQECVGAKLCRFADGITGVGEAFTKGASVAAGEATSPLKARHPHAGGIEQPSGLALREIGDLRTPHRKGVEPVAPESVEFFCEVPAKGRPFTD